MVHGTLSHPGPFWKTSQVFQKKSTKLIVGCRYYFCEFISTIKRFARQRHYEIIDNENYSFAIRKKWTSNFLLDFVIVIVLLRVFPACGWKKRRKACQSTKKHFENGPGCYAWWMKRRPKKRKHTPDDWVSWNFQIEWK